MTEVESLTVQILQQIRDELRLTRQELSAQIGETNQRLDQTNQRIDQTNQRLDQSNLRLNAVEGTLNELATQMVFLVKHARNSAKRERRIESDVRELKERVARLEVHTGLPPTP